MSIDRGRHSLYGKQAADGFAILRLPEPRGLSYALQVTPNNVARVSDKSPDQDSQYKTPRILTTFKK
ncbi:hypothetical protein WJX73_006409 [Symbiochloris irregularis]|uniref:Uncharacterized protein n=1 Tax=Symbiochloris irregularis TaxID=706552 RepID=A0AAW1P4A8_9CHLO